MLEEAERVLKAEERAARATRGDPGQELAARATVADGKGLVVAHDNETVVVRHPQWQLRKLPSKVKFWIHAYKRE
eukprot:5557535-Amphidinium_carterae.1